MSTKSIGVKLLLGKMSSKSLDLGKLKSTQILAQKHKLAALLGIFKGGVFRAKFATKNKQTKRTNRFVGGCVLVGRPMALSEL